MSTAENTGTPCHPVKCEDGSWLYFPLFTGHELAVLTPEEKLERVRQCHIEHEQFDILALIDEGVRTKGNPYVPTVIFPPQHAAKSE
ncbi:MAG: hypothetical protein IJ113_05380 [Eggerthellaceae bacterium]|nr:hypothetical protein [Eggerthellaceae bacterium]